MRAKHFPISFFAVRFRRVAQIDGIPRMGRSQGATIFWGLVSVFFAAAACYYFWKNHEDEKNARQLRDDVLTLQDQCDSLNAQKNKLQSGIGDAEKQLKAREDFLQEKETKLAAEESRLETLGQQSHNQSQQNRNQEVVVKKFDDTVRKLARGDDTDVVLRGGRPVLRVPNSIFFAFGDAALKPEGKALLDQIARALNGHLDNFELRLECYTDNENDIQKSASPGNSGKPVASTAPVPRYATSWELTAARAGALARYFHEGGSLPFQNVIVMGRGDSQPIVPNAKDGHARNRRIEITIAPLPVPFHASEPSHANENADSTTPLNPLEPPPDTPTTGNKKN
jgi:flagellar motor protein MotB